MIDITRIKGHEGYIGIDDKDFESSIDKIMSSIDITIYYKYTELTVGFDYEPEEPAFAESICINSISSKSGDDITCIFTEDMIKEVEKIILNLRE